jgi:hypothetical protein
MNWDKTFIDLGDVYYQDLPNERIIVEFNYLSKNEDIEYEQFETSCSCMNMKLINKKLIVWWTPRKEKKPYTTNRYIYVHYPDQTIEKLHITGKIYN